MKTLTRRSQLSSVSILMSGVLVGSLYGCGGEQAAEVTPPSGANQLAAQEAPVAAETASVSPSAAVEDDGVFPTSLARGFEHLVTVSIPTGGHAAAGIICRGSGGDMAYVGVKGATGVADGVHIVRLAGSEGDSVKVNFATGAPDSGVGMGAVQSRLEDGEYSLTFEGLEVELTVPGCNS